MNYELWIKKSRFKAPLRDLPPVVDSLSTTPWICPLKWVFCGVEKLDKNWRVEGLKNWKIERLKDWRIEELKDWRIEELKDWRIEKLKGLKKN